MPRNPRLFTPLRPRSTAGFTLVEVLAVLALTALVLALGLPALRQATDALRLEMAAREIATSLQAARLFAVRHRANVAMKFAADGEGAVTYGLYRDGDDDGVRTSDIERGIDPVVWAPRRVSHQGGRLRFGFPPGPPPRHPGTGRRLDRLDDPVRFNRSDLASFSPLGTATPGSVYLTDGRRLAVVRVHHLSGKISSQVYDAETGTWH